MFSIFHALFYHACKARWISFTERNSILIKERHYLSIHFFGSWLQYYYRRFNRLFWGRYKKLVHHLLFPHFPVNDLLISKKIEKTKHKPAADSRIQTRTSRRQKFLWLAYLHSIHDTRQIFSKICDSAIYLATRASRAS